MVRHHCSGRFDRTPLVDLYEKVRYSYSTNVLPLGLDADEAPREKRLSNFYCSLTFSLRFQHLNLAAIHMPAPNSGQNNSLLRLNRLNSRQSFCPACGAGI